ncbi:MAG: hypothetical protein Q9209_006952 [Squamulea sp. 1 TL-2023]
MDVFSSTSTFGFFSFPPEIRLEIYTYLAPTRIRISPMRDFLEASDKPWALAFVSRQFRHELRHTTYSSVILHVETDKAVQGASEAYEAWISGFGENLGPLTRRLVIDRLVDIEWMPDTEPVSGPKIWRKKYLSQELDGWESEGEAINGKSITSDCGYSWTQAEILTETIGDWEIRYRRWLWSGTKTTPNRHIGAIKEVLATIDKRIGKRKLNTAVIGLCKEDIRKLVAAYRGIGDGDATMDDETSVEVVEDMAGLEFESSEW